MASATSIWISAVPLIDGQAFLSRAHRSIPCDCVAEVVVKNPSNFFVRVKTVSNPSGALRGQLRPGTFQGVGASVFTSSRSYAGSDLFRLGALLGNLGGDVVGTSQGFIWYLSPQPQPSSPSVT